MLCSLPLRTFTDTRFKKGLKLITKPMLWFNRVFRDPMTDLQLRFYESTLFTFYLLNKLLTFSYFVLNHFRPVFHRFSDFFMRYRKGMLG